MIFPTMSRRRFAGMSAVDQAMDPGASMSAPKTQSPQGGPVDGPRRGGGIFGSLGRWLTPERMEIIGATLRQVGGEQGALAEVAEQRRAAGLESLGRQERKREWAREDQQQRALEEAIATLDPSQQAWARLAPGAAAQRAMSPPQQPEYDIDAEGRPYTIQNGSVQYGQGRVSVPQRGGERAPPAGYRWTPDGNMEPVPGGPADQRQTETGRRYAASLDTAIRNRENVLSAIREARSLASNDSGTTGMQGQIFRGVGGNRAFDLNATVDTIIGNIGFEALQEMRANSQTGGALGQVAVRELELLQTTIASLDTAQSQDQFLRNLDRVQQQYDRTLQAMRQARSQFDQTPSPVQQRGGQAPRVIELDP